MLSNTEPKHLFSRVEAGDTRWKLYSLPVEPQKGERIA